MDNDRLDADIIETTTVHNTKHRTYKPAYPHPISSRMTGNRPEGYSVVRWPEFLALAKRLGIDLELPFRDLTICIPFEGLVEITQTYLADDIDQPDTKTVFED